MEQTQAIETRQEINKKINQIERELLEKHRDWPQEKARLIAMKLLCLIN